MAIGANKTRGRPPRADQQLDFGPNLARIFELVLNDNHDEIKEKLIAIMANQAEFDAQLDRIEAAVLAEKAQIEAFIAANPTLNTSRLATIATNIDAIFTPAETETETETTEETTET